MNPIVPLAAFFAAAGFIIAFCAVILSYRINDLIKLADERANLPHELVTLERRTLWNISGRRV